jgi:hypothetical protein
MTARMATAQHCCCLCHRRPADADWPGIRLCRSCLASCEERARKGAAASLMPPVDDLYLGYAAGLVLGKSGLHGLAHNFGSAEAFGATVH